MQRWEKLQPVVSPKNDHTTQDTSAYTCVGRFEKGGRDMKKKMMAIPSIDMEATGRNITRLRQQAGLTVRDLQEIFGFTTPQAIYKWQHGTAMPAIDNLVVLAAVLHVSIDEIVIVETRELVLASA